jgi:hypothetical protein
MKIADVIASFLRTTNIILALVCQCSFLTNASFAHPASGIVVDAQGHVYFIYSGHGVMRIDASGKLMNIHEDKGGHWLALDIGGAFSQVRPKRFERITPDGQITSILKSERPWSPTGVAVRSEDIYVLQYTNANGPAKEGWYPRARKRAMDGTWVTLVTVPPEISSAY